MLGPDPGEGLERSLQPSIHQPCDLRQAPDLEWGDSGLLLWPRKQGDSWHLPGTCQVFRWTMPQPKRAQASLRDCGRGHPSTSLSLPPSTRSQPLGSSPALPGAQPLAPGHGCQLVGARARGGGAASSPHTDLINSALRPRPARRVALAPSSPHARPPSPPPPPRSSPDLQGGPFGQGAVSAVVLPCRGPGPVRCDLPNQEWR